MSPGGICFQCCGERVAQGCGVFRRMMSSRQGKWAGSLKWTSMMKSQRTTSWCSSCLRILAFNLVSCKAPGGQVKRKWSGCFTRVRHADRKEARERGSFETKLLVAPSPLSFLLPCVSLWKCGTCLLAVHEDSGKWPYLELERCLQQGVGKTTKIFKICHSVSTGSTDVALQQLCPADCTPENTLKCLLQVVDGIGQLS